MSKITQATGGLTMTDRAQQIWTNDDLADDMGRLIEELLSLPRVFEHPPTFDTTHGLKNHAGLARTMLDIMQIY